jgi:hypothetical protein
MICFLSVVFPAVFPLRIAHHIFTMKSGLRGSFTPSEVYQKMYGKGLAALLLMIVLSYVSLRASFRHQILPLHTKFISKNVAAIIEDRPLSSLAPLLLHFSSVLGPEWPILLFTSEGKEPKSPAFRRAIEDGRITIRRLPEDLEFTKHQAVTEFLTTPWFWEQLMPAGHVFMFQADSIICTNANITVSDFLEYDFVGAPISPTRIPILRGQGYNGGFSLRNVSLTLEIVKKASWQAELEDGMIFQEPCAANEPCQKFEDQWFYHKMKILGARLPTIEVAKKFSVETEWYETPLGYHQVDRWWKDKESLAQIHNWCPEHALATTDLLINHKKTASEKPSEKSDA